MGRTFWEEEGVAGSQYLVEPGLTWAVSDEDKGVGSVGRLLGSLGKL